MKKLTIKQKELNIVHEGVAALYKSGKHTTEQIAKNYSISPRQVQRIATKYKIIRSQAEANRVAAPLKNYHTIPFDLRVKRKQLTNKLRYELIAAQPYCSNCGQVAGEGIRLEIDHIDENPENNDRTNLQVLCSKCNNGKSQLSRFGSS